jgi:DNA modification methylase
LSTTQQQEAVAEITETSIKFKPQYFFSILKENEAITTAKAMSVDTIFTNPEYFILQSYKYLANH